MDDGFGIYQIYYKNMRIKIPMYVGMSQSAIWRYLHIQHYFGYVPFDFRDKMP